jgi:hypothetical protein
MESASCENKNCWLAAPIMCQMLKRQNVYIGMIKMVEGGDFPLNRIYAVDEMFACYTLKH